MPPMPCAINHHVVCVIYHVWTMFVCIVRPISNIIKSQQENDAIKIKRLGYSCSTAHFKFYKKMYLTKLVKLFKINYYVHLIEINWG